MSAENFYVSQTAVKAQNITGFATNAISCENWRHKSLAFPALSLSDGNSYGQSAERVVQILRMASKSKCK